MSYNGWAQKCLPHNPPCLIEVKKHKLVKNAHTDSNYNSDVGNTVVGRHYCVESFLFLCYRVRVTMVDEAR